MDGKIAAIIPCRYESSRLPGKVLLPLLNAPALGIIIDRLRQSKFITNIIVAVSDRSKFDNIILEYCENREVNQYIYKGDYEDVLGRVTSCAIDYELDIIVDVTQDSPLITPAHIDFLIGQVLTHDLDYASNDVVKRSWIDGGDIQVITKKALIRTNEITKEKCMRLHSLYNCACNPDKFNIFHWSAPDEFEMPEVKLCLDTVEDYLLLNRIFNHFGNIYFSLEEATQYIKEYQGLLEINREVRRKLPGEG